MMMLNTASHRPRGHQQLGVTIIEAMVAVVVMAFGMVAIAGLQSKFRRTADVAKQSGEAVRLAQQDMEAQRAFSSVLVVPNAPEGTRAYGDVSDANYSFSTDTNATFAITRSVESLPAFFGLKSVYTRVSWADRAGENTQVELKSLIAPVDPSLAAFLQQPVEGTPTRRPLDRSSVIPVGAKNIDPSTSAFKPLPGSNLVLVFNNLTGTIVAKCNVAKSQNDLTLEDFAGCKLNVPGYLLSGFVRFSTGAVADPEAPNSLALNVGVALTLTSQGHNLDPSYECFSNALDVAGTTAPVAYYCVVYPNSDATPSWSGRLNITGLTIAPAGYRTCRYSADYNGNGSIGNEEHPLDYVKVTQSLARQNFLVTQYSVSCPAGQPVDPATGHFLNTATVNHQS